jgi:hypothetical protein
LPWDLCCLRCSVCVSRLPGPRLKPRLPDKAGAPLRMAARVMRGGARPPPPAHRRLRAARCALLAFVSALQRGLPRQVSPLTANLAKQIRRRALRPKRCPPGPRLLCIVFFWTLGSLLLVATRRRSAHRTKRNAPHWPLPPRRRPFRPHFTYLYRLVLTRSRCP